MNTGQTMMRRVRRDTRCSSLVLSRMLKAFAPTMGAAVAAVLRPAAFGAAVAAILGAGPAAAVTVVTPFTGTIDFAEAGNPFGLTTSDTLSGTVTLDDSILLGAGSAEVSIDDPGFIALQLTVGAALFDDSMDTAGGFPRVTVSGGAVTGINFFVTGFAFDGTTVTEGGGDLTLDASPTAGPDFEWIIAGSAGQQLAGTFLFPVEEGLSEDLPEPGALALVGVGLLGLGAARCRRRRRP